MLLKNMFVPLLVGDMVGSHGDFICQACKKYLKEKVVHLRRSTSVYFAEIPTHQLMSRRDTFVEQTFALVDCW